MLAGMEDNRSAIWGGATIGFVVGLILGFFVGNYWTTVLYAILIGAASGVLANVLAWPAHRREMKRREHASRAASGSLVDTAEDRRTVDEHLFETSEDYRAQAESILETSENILRSTSPDDFEKHNAFELVYMVEDGENWRAGYDSLESFYAAHEERHPDVRQYAARAKLFLDDREKVLREGTPGDFETTPYAAIDCIAAAHAVVDREVWRTGYDSLESFYRAHEARHPDIRVYAAVYSQGYAESARGDPSLVRGRNIAQQIADLR